MMELAKDTDGYFACGWRLWQPRLDGGVSVDDIIRDGGVYGEDDTEEDEASGRDEEGGVLVLYDVNTLEWLDWGLGGAKMRLIKQITDRISINNNYNIAIITKSTSNHKHLGYKWKIFAGKP